ncbi:MAG: tRNA pseudouridine(55) synthase TruB [Clostridiales bacterium]|nr:tRNA pseudouridine(55) synthase TruB [Clostridiales bacterium]
MTGVICIDKSAGITSLGVCKAVARILGEKKCGHTGTLDPMATGLMIVLLGGATRFAEFIPDTEKSYRASFILGKTTDTYDITGKLTGEYEVSAGPADVQKALIRFKGKIMQLPPMYSAVSKNGQRLYKLARAGIEVERSERQIEITRLELVSAENGEYVIDIVCSRGTYIRTLIDDIGKALGCGAVMTSLRRTGAAGFLADNALTIDELEKISVSGAELSKHVLSVDSVLKEKPLYVSEKQAVRFKNGGALDSGRVRGDAELGTLYKIYSDSGEFLGLGLAAPHEIKVKRVLVNK